MDKPKVVIAADHAGYTLKEIVAKAMEKKGYEVIDIGTHSDQSVDYPDFAHPLSDRLLKSPDLSFGILICGSGNGVAMTANKHENIRAAISWNEEVARLAKQHNNANVLALPARFITQEEALRIIDAFLESEFEGGRHQRRVSKISIC